MLNLETAKKSARMRRARGGVIRSQSQAIRHLRTAIRADLVNDSCSARMVPLGPKVTCRPDSANECRRTTPATRDFRPYRGVGPSGRIIVVANDESAAGGWYEHTSHQTSAALAVS